MLFRRKHRGVEERKSSLRELFTDCARDAATGSAGAAQPAPRAVNARHAPVHARLHRYTATPAAGG
jgi:hypothetical protein